MGGKKTLLIEPFYGGSHKQLIDLLYSKLDGCVKYTLPGKKWPWRARTSALYFSQTIPHDHDFSFLFCSSVLNLAELIALRPDLAKLHKVIYFHENQLVYPVRKDQERDFQFGYNQILSSLVADVVLFNSAYNKESFLSNIDHHLKLIPSHRPRNLRALIAPKCSVLYFPVELPTENEYLHSMSGDICEELQGCNCNSTHLTKSTSWNSDTNSCESCTDIRSENCSYEAQGHESLSTNGTEKPELQNILSSESDLSETVCEVNRPGKDGRVLHILWPHRWEHDKNPEAFFNVLYKLQESGASFKVSVLGECFSEIPVIFSEAKSRLHDHIAAWGYMSSKADYWQTLHQADVVVSTADHEFYGVAMLEAVWMKCYPLCPNRLVYPEIFPKCCLYNTENQLYKKLLQFCGRPYMAARQQLKMDWSKFSWSGLESQYKQLLQNVP